MSTALAATAALAAAPAGGTLRGSDMTTGEGAPPSFSPAPALSPSRFSAKPVRGQAASYLVFSISEAATLQMRVSVARPGRREHGHCAAPSRANRGHRRCTRWVALGTLSTPALPGANRTPFTPRVDKRLLAPGAYRLTIVATDAAGASSPPAVAGFTIVR